MPDIAASAKRPGAGGRNVRPGITLNLKSRSFKHKEQIVDTVPELIVILHAMSDDNKSQII